MKKMSIISSSDLRLVQGVNLVTRYLTECNTYFSKLQVTKVYSASQVLDITAGESMPIGSDLGRAEYRIRRMIRSVLRGLLDSKYEFGARIKYSLNIDRPAYRTVQNFIKDDHDTDFLILQNPWVAYYFLKLRTNKNIKTVFIVHSQNDDLSQFFDEFPFFKEKKYQQEIFAMRDFVYENVDQVVYISEKSYQNSRLIIRRKSMIYNGIPEYENINAMNKHDGINLVCVGSMNGRKGQELILDALGKIKKSILKKVHLFLIGDGAERNNLEKQVDLLGINENVTFMGMRNDVEVLLGDMDVFIMPSKSEGLSISTLEALRAGLFLLLTDTGGNCEVMGCNCGMVVRRSGDDIKEKIERIILDNVVSFEQKKRSIDRFQKIFTLRKMAENYESLFFSL